MALKMVVDTLDGLPETVAPLYEKGDDGKFRLSLDGYEDPVNLKKALHSEREARKEFERKARLLDEYGDMKPEDIKRLRDIKSREENDEELQLINAGKINEVWERRSQAMRKDYEKKLDGATKSVEAERTKAQSLVQRAIDSELRAASAKVGVHNFAVEDVLLHGRQLFTIDDEGSVVQVKNGEIVYGKDGKTPLSPTEWLEAKRESSPHWFPASGSGSGSPAQGAARSTRGKTMKRDAFQALPPAQRVATLKEGITVID
jgi:hypothetical protein